MNLILTEKPSVARDIKAVFQNVKQHILSGGVGYYKGEYQGQSYIITWCLGHLVQLKDPSEHNKIWENWELNTLPIYPEKFQYKPIKKSIKQLKIIQDIFNKFKIKKCILATDADREGELLGRLVLNYCNWNGPTYRFWTSLALEPKVVAQTLNNLQPIKDFNTLYLAGLARQHADYVVGFTLTRGITVATQQREIWSAGRVQSPIICLLAEREEKIKNFKPEPFWTINEKKINATLIYSSKLKNIPQLFDDNQIVPEKNNKEEESVYKISTSPFRFKYKNDADIVFNKIKNESSFLIKNYSKTQKKEQPPLLFNLTDLQKEANKYYGFSAEKTLSIAQTLYEKHKIISYPRTESRYMGTSNKSLIKKIYEIFSKKEFPSKKNKIYNDKQVAKAGHHAIIPLKQPTHELTKEEKQIFNLILKRFLSAFDKEHIYMIYSAILDCHGYLFYTSSKETIYEGWRKFYPPNWKPFKKHFPELKEGETISIQELIQNKGETKPPPRFTEASILTLMTNVWRFVEDPKLKEALKKAQGLGTPATRGNHIKNLKDRNYMQLKGKSIKITDKGLTIKKIIKDQLKLNISDIGFSALWEEELNKIIQGQSSYEDFMAKTKKIIKNEVNKLIKYKEEIKKMSENINNKPKIICPNCQKELRTSKAGYFCGKWNPETKENEGGCGFVLFKKQYGKTLSDKQLVDLLNGKKILVKNLVSKKKNTTYDAYLQADNLGKVQIAGFPKK